MRKNDTAPSGDGEFVAGVKLFLRHTLIWAVALGVVGTLQNVVRAPHVALGPGQLEYGLVQMFALFLVFGSFAGGVAVFNGLRDGGSKPAVVAAGGLVAALAFVLNAEVAPRLEYRADVLRGADLEVFAPFGPLTPDGYREWLAYLRQNPPTDFSLSVDRLREHPPARVEFRLHQNYVIPLLSVLLGLMGHVAAELTAPIRPSRRRHVRWLIGLAMLPLVIVPLDAFEATTIARPFGSGVAPVWAGLLVPGAVLTLCWAITHAIRGHRDRLGRRAGARSSSG